MKQLLPEISDLFELRHQAHSIGLASHHAVNSVLCGLYKSVFKGQGMDFDEVREYQHGDEIRNMDWRVTARTNTPHLKVYREERQRTVMLCVDIGSHMMFGTRKTFKNIQAAKVAALLGWAASSNKDRVGALLFGDITGLRYFRPSHAKRSLWQMLQSMTTINHTATSPRTELPKAIQKLIHSTPTGALILIIADFNYNFENLQHALGKLRQKHEIILLPIDDNADQTIPAMGKIMFTQSNGQQCEIDTDSETGRQKYKQTWTENRQQINSICKKLGIDIIEISTHDDVHSTLIKSLRKRVFHHGK
ncbi:MAG: DUF58 domain-containing protein [Methylococcales bacterium]|jgi:uncharacterized protein (DUF58 family)|nr:DUF58 domain-containing protein [Methylococcales bacterium]MBT7409123.1 DUF58 domain-containing protein [Methylococcales bacterium]